MRASEVIGGLAVVGVVALIGLAIADDADSDTITTPTAPTILAPVDSTADTTTSTTEPPTTEPSVPESTDLPVETEPVETDSAVTTTLPETTTTTTPSLSDEERSAVRLRVANSGGVAGAATFVTGVLDGAGFAPTNPADGVVRVTQDTVLFAPGQEAAAAAVNESINAAPEFVVEANPEDPNWAEFGAELDVLVLVGPP